MRLSLMMTHMPPLSNMLMVSMTFLFCFFLLDSINIYVRICMVG